MEWTEKYRPATLADITGNTTAIRQMADWAKNWTPRSRPLLLYGKPGIGKTSSAYALAHDMGWDVIELNASDQRTAAAIERIAGAGSMTASLTGSSRKLILLDEADNLQGNADRGGAKAIIDCIRHSLQPIILIANDLYGISPELRARCEPVQFRAIPARSLAPRLKYLCAAEKITCTEEAIRTIAESAGGDVRSAVNMLYASALGKDRLEATDVRTAKKDERITIFSLVSALFSQVPDRELMRLAREAEDTPESIIQWVEGSIHLIRDPASAARAYRHLSRADEFLGHTYRRQYHTLWRYATAIMILGVADAAGGKGIHDRIMPPERWRRMASAKKQKTIRAAVFGKVSAKLHVPRATLRERYLDEFSVLVTHDPMAYARDLQLDSDQLNFFLHDQAAAHEVSAAMAREEKEREKEQKKAKKAKVPAKAAPPEIPKADEPSQDNISNKRDSDPDMPPETVVKKAVSQSTLFDGF
jgi:replication factor C large subunit